MNTVTRFFNHAQEKLQQVLEHEMPNKSTYLERIEGYSQALNHRYSKVPMWMVAMSITIACSTPG